LLDKSIPLKICNENQDEWSEYTNIYCPDFQEDDFLFGDYETAKRSILHVAIHYCDQNKLDQVDKTCKSKEETDNYL